MARSIVITSGKGGVGKTTLVANLGRSLADLGQRVVLMDTDLGLNNLDVLMNIENKVVFDIIDVIENRCRTAQALIEDKTVKGLFVLPSCHSYDASKINGQNIKAVVSGLARSFDYILLDCPAGIEVGFHRAVSAAGEAIVVTTPHISSIRDADKVIALLKSYQIDPISIIVNRARGDLILNSEMVDYKDIGRILKTPPLGVVPEDDAINLLSNLGLTVDSKSDGFSAIALLAKNLHCGTTEMFDVTKKYKGILGGLKRNLRKII
ncbi:MAG: septum site-determining protein MinD [Clostridiales bacterium]|jgi:septum site-determining protein MinD|nr:septum site-determining protein MinD [Clostridiales bacterium]